MRQILPFIRLCTLWMLPLVICHAKMLIWENVAYDDFPQALKDAIVSNQQPNWQDGFLDVTKAPFGATGDGVTDDTQKFQDALDMAFENNFVIWVPSGTYRFTGPLHLQQNVGGKNRKFTYKIVGSTQGTRPLFKLDDNANLSVFRTQQTGQPALDTTLKAEIDHTFVRAYMVNTDGTQDSSRLYGIEFRNIDINMGNNPDGIALMVNGAQLCVVEDVKIYGQAFKAGIKDCPGAAAGMGNIEIDGGTIGIWQTEYRRAPSIVGLKLTNQSLYGVKIDDSYGPFTIVGASITSLESPSSDYRAIILTAVNYDGGDRSHGTACIVDTQIEVKGTGGIAVESSAAMLYMLNTYIKADVMVDAGTIKHQITPLTGDHEAWKRIPSYTYTDWKADGILNIDSVEYNDYSLAYHDDAINEPVEDAEPPATLLTKHVWDAATFPSWEDSNVIRVTDSAFGAVPDDSSVDNAQAIQDAIDYAVANDKTLLVPRGHFYIQNPITLKTNLRMIGAGNNISVIHLSPFDWQPDPTTFNNAIETENSATGELILSKLCFVGQEPQDTKTNKFTINHLKTTLLHLQQNNMQLRDLQFDRQSYYVATRFEAPFIQIDNNAGGFIWNMPLDYGPYTITSQNKNIGHYTSDTFPTSTANSWTHVDYCKVKFQNLTNPLNIYQLDSEYELNERGQIVFENCQNVNLFALKYEEVTQYAEFINCDNFAVIGGSGNYNIVDSSTPGMFELTNCDDFLISILGRRNIPGRAGYNASYLLLKDNDTSYGLPQSATLALYQRGFLTLNDNSPGQSQHTETILSESFDYASSWLQFYYSTSPYTGATVDFAGDELTYTTSANWRYLVARFGWAKIDDGESLTLRFDLHYTSNPGTSANNLMFGIFNNGGTQPAGNGSATTASDDNGYFVKIPASPGGTSQLCYNNGTSGVLFTKTSLLGSGSDIASQSSAQEYKLVLSHVGSDIEIKLYVGNGLVASGTHSSNLVTGFHNIAIGFDAFAPEVVVDNIEILKTY